MRTLCETDEGLDEGLVKLTRVCLYFTLYCACTYLYYGEPATALLHRTVCADRCLPRVRKLGADELLFGKSTRAMSAQVTPLVVVPKKIDEEIPAAAPEKADAQEDPDGPEAGLKGTGKEFYHKKGDKNYWRQTVPINIQKLNELSIFGNPPPIAM